MAAEPAKATSALEKVKRKTLSNPAVLRALHRLGIGAKEQAPKPTGELKLTVRPGLTRKVTAP